MLKKHVVMVSIALSIVFGCTIISGLLFIAQPIYRRYDQSKYLQSWELSFKDLGITNKFHVNHFTTPGQWDFTTILGESLFGTHGTSSWLFNTQIGDKRYQISCGRIPKSSCYIETHPAN